MAIPRHNPDPSAGSWRATRRETGSPEFHGGVEGHGVKRVRRELQSLVRLRGGQLGIGVFERQIRHQHMRFHQLGIEFDGLWSYSTALSSKPSALTRARPT